MFRRNFLAVLAMGSVAGCATQANNTTTQTMDTEDFPTWDEVTDEMNIFDERTAFGTWLMARELHRQNQILEAWASINIEYESPFEDSQR
jgi:hypothetical protein